MEDRRGAGLSEPGGWCDVGRCYFNGIGTQQDEAYAVRCFEKGIAKGETGSSCLLGKAYYYGRGVQQDYAKAFQLLSNAYNQGNAWGIYYLGECCFNGWGTPQDYAAARMYLEQVDWDNSDVYYMLGFLYGRGLGVAADIPKGVAQGPPRCLPCRCQICGAYRSRISRTGSL